MASPDRKSHYELILFADATQLLELQGALAALRMNPENGAVDMGTYPGTAELNAALEAGIREIAPSRGCPECISVMKVDERVLPNNDAVCFSLESLQQLSILGMGLEYAYYASFHRESRFRDTASFFLITFPEGEPSGNGEQALPELFCGRYKGQPFILTTDQNSLWQLISDLAEQGSQCPAFRIDYFSCGSFIRWELWPENVRDITALQARMELRIHPAMLTAGDDALKPLIAYLLRSKVWRKRLQPSPAAD